MVESLHRTFTALVESSSVCEFPLFHPSVTGGHLFNMHHLSKNSIAAHQHTEAVSHCTWQQDPAMWTSSRCCSVPRPRWMPRAISAGGPSWDGIFILNRWLGKMTLINSTAKSVASRSILQYHVFERVACSVAEFDFCIQ